jgi:hypothetical protein
MLHLNGCLSLVFDGKTADAPSRPERDVAILALPPKLLGRAAGGALPTVLYSRLANSRLHPTSQRHSFTVEAKMS